MVLQVHSRIALGRKPGREHRILQPTVPDKHNNSSVGVGMEIQRASQTVRVRARVRAKAMARARRMAKARKVARAIEVVVLEADEAKQPAGRHI